MERNSIQHTGYDGALDCKADTAASVEQAKTGEKWSISGEVRPKQAICLTK
jgi:hypothetical protein